MFTFSCHPELYSLVLLPRDPGASAPHSSHFLSFLRSCLFLLVIPSLASLPNFRGIQGRQPRISHIFNFPLSQFGTIPYFLLSPSERFPRQTGEMSQRDKRGAPRVSGVWQIERLREDLTDADSQISTNSSSRALIPCSTSEGSRGVAPHSHHNLTSQTAKSRAALL